MMNILYSRGKPAIQDGTHSFYRLILSRFSPYIDLPSDFISLILVLALWEDLTSTASGGDISLFPFCVDRWPIDLRGLGHLNQATSKCVYTLQQKTLEKLPALLLRQNTS